MKKKHYKKLQHIIVILAAIAPLAYVACYLFMFGLYPDHILLEMTREKYLHSYALLAIGSMASYFAISCMYMKALLTCLSMGEERFRILNYLSASKASFATILAAALLDTVMHHYLVLAFGKLHVVMQCSVLFISILSVLTFNKMQEEKDIISDFKYPIVTFFVFALMMYFFYHAQGESKRYKEAKLCKAEERDNESDESCNHLCLELNDGKIVETAYFDRLIDNTIIVRNKQFELIDNSRIKGRKVCEKPSKEQN